MTTTSEVDIPEAVRQLQYATAARKCWSCGCFRGTLDSVEKEWPEETRGPELNAAVREGRERLVPVQYDCLGCEVCFPAIAANALGVQGECAAPPVEARDGWPPLPGAYHALRYQAPVAVCTLTSEPLAETIADAGHSLLSLVGTLYTENLGIERVIANIVSNPNIRFLIVCGADSKQAIGHLPGQSLVALSQFGLDDRAQIVGAKGKRPLIRNTSPAAIEHFRKTVEVVDLLGVEDLQPIYQAVEQCGHRDPGPAEPFAQGAGPRHEAGRIPARMIPDPAGYFVIYIDGRNHTLSAEHYFNNGVLNVIIEGHSASEIYIRAVELNLISRLDHAAYLGRELARAERALESGELYVQDAAPESAIGATQGCGCGGTCSGERPS